MRPARAIARPELRTLVNGFYDRRLHTLVEREGLHVNHKRVYGIYIQGLLGHDVFESSVLLRSVWAYRAGNSRLL